MNTVACSFIAQLSPSLATPVGAPKGIRAAREFEASLIASLLESLEKTFAAVPGETNLPGADDYNYLGAQALASGIAAHGGFGIATLIAAHLPARK